MDRVNGAPTVGITITTVIGSLAIRGPVDVNGDGVTMKDVGVGGTHVSSVGITNLNVTLAIVPASHTPWMLLA